MRAIKFMLAFAVCLSLFSLASGRVFAAEGSKAALKVGTIKWNISVKPQFNMVDLYLTELGSGKDVRNVKLRAVITLPNGEKVEKEMMHMAMKKVKGKSKSKGASYMFSLDLSAPGAYVFDITGKAGKRDIQIHVNYVVKPNQVVK